MSCADHVTKRLRARELRLAGWSRAQIAREVGIRNQRTLQRWLHGVPVPAWTSRSNAKDDLRDDAVKLRREGQTYAEIRRVLGVSKSSLSLWLRDVYLTAEQRHVLESKYATAPQRRGATNRARRAAARALLRATAADEIAALSRRELFLIGSILYWAEGAKAKSWRPSQCVSFINSDPGLVRLFLAWLNLVGVEADRLSFRLSIHESADLLESERYWRGVICQPDARFMRPQLKKHVPTTNRRNVGAEYRGCLIIRVSRSTELYRRIEGWVDGIVSSLGRSVTGSTERLGRSREGSNPSGPAAGQATLFESSAPYQCQSAG